MTNCIWVKDDENEFDSEFQTMCGKYWVFTPSNPKPKWWRYCPSCGKKIAVAKVMEEK